MSNPSDPHKTPASTRPAKRVSRKAAAKRAAAAVATTSPNVVANIHPSSTSPAIAAVAASSSPVASSSSSSPSTSQSSPSLGSLCNSSSGSGGSNNSQPNTPSPQQQLARAVAAAVAAKATTPTAAPAATAPAVTPPPPTPFLPRLDGPVAVQQRLRTIVALLCATPDRMGDWARQLLAIPCANAAWLSLCVRAVCDSVIAVHPDPAAVEFVRDGLRSRLMAQFCRAIGEAGAAVAQSMWTAGEAARGGRPATTLAALAARTNAVAAQFRRDVVEAVQAGIIQSVKPLSAAAVAGQPPLAVDQLDRARRRRGVRTMCFLCDLFICGNGGDHQLVTTHVMRFVGDQLLPSDTGEPHGPPIDELRMELACLMLSSVGALLESQSMAEANVYYRRGRADLRVYFMRLERVLAATVPRADRPDTGRYRVDGRHGHGAVDSDGDEEEAAGGGGGEGPLLSERVRDMMREVVELRNRRWRP